MVETREAYFQTLMSVTQLQSEFRELLDRLQQTGIGSGISLWRGSALGNPDKEGPNILLAELEIRLKANVRHRQCGESELLGLSGPGGMMCSICFFFLQCNNPKTKEPKLTAAARIVPEWVEYDSEIKGLLRKVQKQEETAAQRQTPSSSSAKGKE